MLLNKTGDIFSVVKFIMPSLIAMKTQRLGFKLWKVLLKQFSVKEIHTCILTLPEGLPIIGFY